MGVFSFVLFWFVFCFFFVFQLLIIFSVSKRTQRVDLFLLYLRGIIYDEGNQLFYFSDAILILPFIKPLT